MNEKFEKIQERIDNISGRQKNIGSDAEKNNRSKNTNIAFNIGIEIVASGIVGIIIGLLIDNLFDSKPIFLIICIILSFIAAFRSIWNKYFKENA